MGARECEWGGVRKTIAGERMRKAGETRRPIVLCGEAVKLDL